MRQPRKAVWQSFTTLYCFSFTGDTNCTNFGAHEYVGTTLVKSLHGNDKVVHNQPHHHPSTLCTCLRALMRELDLGCRSLMTLMEDFICNKNNIYIYPMPQESE